MRRIALVLVLLAAVVPAVFAAGPWSDGVYTAEGNSFSHGWKNMVRVVVENGYIVDAHFDAIPEEGEKYKYLSSVQGEYGMVANSDATDPWYVQADRAVVTLLETQDPAGIVRQGEGADAISGVSITIMPHFELAERALRGARR